ncbi:MAG: hypothetical protein FD125_411 [bacterium]|nr:MAG: hypothetical protein FD125_411 [bacterium]
MLLSGLCVAIFAAFGTQTLLEHRARAIDYRPGDPVVRLYAADLAGGAPDPTALVEAITRSGADIVVLQNVGPVDFDAIEATLPALRYRVSAQQAASATGGGETLIASRYALLGREEDQSASSSTLRTLARTPVGRIELIVLSAVGKPSGSPGVDRAPGVAAVAVAWQPGFAAASLRGQGMLPIADRGGLRLPGWRPDEANAVWRSSELGVVAHRAAPPIGGLRPALIADLNLSRRR